MTCDNKGDWPDYFLRKVLPDLSNVVDLLNSLAALTYERGDIDGAVALYEKAIAANPDFANSYYGKAGAFNKISEWFTRWHQ